MSEKREKFYTVSARLVFSAILVVAIVALILAGSSLVNKGPILPLFWVIGAGETPLYAPSTSVNGTFLCNTTPTTSPVIIEVTCAPTNSTFRCPYPYFNYTTGIFTVELSQDTGFNWTSVTVVFVPSNTAYSHGVPHISWSPPGAVNVTGGLLSNATKYINIPITSGRVAVGTNITGSIWAKYQLNIGGTVSYANMSSAIIVVKR